VLLAGAAFFLAIGIWTMHFVGMLAAPLPAGAVYLVLPTIVSFLICALVDCVHRSSGSEGGSMLRLPRGSRRSACYGPELYRARLTCQTSLQVLQQ
jgi:hypothetical protein